MAESEKTGGKAAEDMPSFEEVAGALAAELNIENRSDNSRDEPENVNEFFKQFEEGPSAEAPEPEPRHEPDDTEEAPQKFVHEPTGKEFDSELDLLRYESGWKSNKIGEYKAQLELLDKLAKDSGGDPQRKDAEMSQEEIENKLLRIAFPDVPQEQLDDPAFKMIAKGMERMITAYHENVAGKQLKTVESRFEEMQRQAAERVALQRAGIDDGKMQKVLEKHPYLKALGPEERMAVIADLAKGGGEKPENPLRQALQPKAADHVEGSVGSVPPEQAEESMARALFEMSDADRLRALGKLFEDSEVGERIRESHI